MSRSHVEPGSVAARLGAMLIASLLLAGCGAAGVAGRGPAAAGVPAAADADAGALQSAAERGALADCRIAQRLIDADSLEAATGMLSQALARDSSCTPALALLSRLDYDAGRHADAVERLEAARERQGSLPRELLAELALHYDALDRPERAREVLASMSRGDQEREGAATVYVMLRGDAADSAGALAGSAARRNPRSAACQNNDGIARLKAADVEGARQAFARAIELDPSVPGPYYNLAILEKFYALDDEAAARWFRAYRERSNEDPDGLAVVFAPPAPARLAQRTQRRTGR